MRPSNKTKERKQHPKDACPQCQDPDAACLIKCNKSRAAQPCVCLYMQPWTRSSCALRLLAHQTVQACACLHLHMSQTARQTPCSCTLTPQLIVKAQHYPPGSNEASQQYKQWHSKKCCPYRAREQLCCGQQPRKLQAIYCQAPDEPKQRPVNRQIQRKQTSRKR